MSDKSDRDNRSNQLNSNNSAYHSSRSNGSNDDHDDHDDHDDYSYSSRDVTESILACMKELPKPKDYITFLIDYVLLNGEIINMKLHFEIHTLKTKGNAEDGAVEVMRSVHWYLTKRFQSEVAYRAVRIEGGVDMVWACDTYKPSRTPITKNPESLATIAKEDELWFMTGEKAVKDFKTKLASDLPIKRLDLGEFDQNKIWNIRTGLAQNQLIKALFQPKLAGVMPINQNEKLV